MPTDHPFSGAAARAGGLLSIDLAALTRNYLRLQRELTKGASCAAVLKANAYGLGTDRVAPVLWNAGARSFFVAHLDEAITLRQLLPEAVIYVLNGLMHGAEAEYPAHDLRPVLSCYEQVQRWHDLCTTQDRSLPAALQVETGMNRLGMPKHEVEALLSQPQILDVIDFTLLMSHLACADEHRHPQNRSQLQNFQRLQHRFPDLPASFANSCGIFLGHDYHFDLARPGYALYGGNPCPNYPNPMAQVVKLQGKILQLRSIDAGESVGYGASYTASGPRKIATLSIGYADGYLRAFSGKASAWIAGQEVPLAGRVSMDLITLDVTGIREDLCAPGQLVDMFGPDGLDALANQGNTIGYELLTSLGQRYHRVYTTETEEAEART